jgi:hypothetical protein
MRDPQTYSTSEGISAFDLEVASSNITFDEKTGYVQYSSLTDSESYYLKSYCLNSAKTMKSNQRQIAGILEVQLLNFKGASLESQDLDQEIQGVVRTYGLHAWLANPRGDPNIYDCLKNLGIYVFFSNLSRQGSRFRTNTRSSFLLVGLLRFARIGKFQQLNILKIQVQSSTPSTAYKAITF